MHMYIWFKLKLIIHFKYYNRIEIYKCIVLMLIMIVVLGQCNIFRILYIKLKYMHVKNITLYICTYSSWDWIKFSFGFTLV